MQLLTTCISRGAGEGGIVRTLRQILGLNGTWAWACRQMRSGEHVRQSDTTGSVHYRMSTDGQERIEWSFAVEEIIPHAEGWNNANMFLSDFESIEWVTCKRLEREI